MSDYDENESDEPLEDEAPDDTIRSIVDYAALLDFIQSKIDKSGGSDACWPWLGKRASAEQGLNYGKVTFRRRQLYVHRIMFALANGFAPLVARHQCDNPPCCNPKHLLPGTQADNVSDMNERGRDWRGPPMFGTRNGSAKLTEDQVREIKAQIARGVDGGVLSRAFGVSPSTISLIRTGKKWSHV